MNTISDGMSESKIMLILYVPCGTDFGSGLHSSKTEHLLVVRTLSLTPQSAKTSLHLKTSGYNQADDRVCKVVLKFL